MDKIGVLFPGQGSHLVGMGKGLYDEYKIVRDTVAEAEAVLGRDIKQLCFNGTLAELTKPENAHVAIFVFSVAAFRVMTKELGYLPEFLAGHSLGEYAALVCAGVIKFSDALKIIELRADIGNKIRHEKNAGMTIVDNVDAEEVQNLCENLQREGKKVFIACYNSKKQVAISGINEDLMLVENLIRENKNAVINPLLVSAPFHCPLMEEGSAQLLQMIENLEFSQFQIPVLSNYTGKSYTGISEVKDSLVKHISNPVRWQQIIDYMINKRLDCFVDVSVNNVFKVQLEHEMKDGKSLVNFYSKVDREKIIKKYQEEEAYSRNRFSLITRCLVAAVSTENKNLKANEYEEKVVKNYHVLEEMKQKYEGREIDEQDKKRAIGILKQIFIGKQVDEKEQKYWLRNVLNYTGNVYLFDEIN